MEIEIGYKTKRTEIKSESPCLLTIGSIIVFNGRKQIVTHTYGHRTYKNINGKIIDITVGYSGFLKDILTGQERRSNWYNVVKEKIIHFEHLDIVKYMI